MIAARVTASPTTGPWPSSSTPLPGTLTNLIVMLFEVVVGLL